MDFLSINYILSLFKNLIEKPAIYHRKSSIENKKLFLLHPNPKRRQQQSKLLNNFFLSAKHKREKSEVEFIRAITSGKLIPSTACEVKENEYKKYEREIARKVAFESFPLERE